MRHEVRPAGTTRSATPPEQKITLERRRQVGWPPQFLQLTTLLAPRPLSNYLPNPMRNSAMRPFDAICQQRQSSAELGILYSARRIEPSRAGRANSVHLVGPSAGSVSPNLNVDRLCVVGQVWPTQSDPLVTDSLILCERARWDVAPKQPCRGGVGARQRHREGASSVPEGLCKAFPVTDSHEPTGIRCASRTCSEISKSVILPARTRDSVCRAVRAARQGSSASPSFGITRRVMQSGRGRFVLNLKAGSEADFAFPRKLGIAHAVVTRDAIRQRVR